MSWTTDDGIAADEIFIRFTEGDWDTTIHDDSGSYDTPAAKLHDSSDTVRVSRRNRVTLAGGTGASILESRYTADNKVIVQN